MKYNYLSFIVLFLIIILKEPIMQNINNLMYIRNNNLEIKTLKNQNEELEKEYQELLTFKNNIKLDNNFTITNTLKTNYDFNKLNINGKYNLNDEVVNENGLIGIITKTNHNFSEMTYLYNTNLTIKIDNITGKIMSKDQNNNLIIGELSNHNNININDNVYSLYNTYIGKVIKINYEVLDTTILVETPNPRNINYVAVISR
mgnify:CR=1 FL=1